MKFLIQLLHDPKLYQYCLVGGIAAIVDLACFLAFYQTLHYHYLLIATFSFMIATMVNFLLCHRFVFKTNPKRSSQARFLLTYLVSGVGLVIHHSCLFLSFELFALPIALSKCFAMGTAFGWNFLSRKYFVFI